MGRCCGKKTQELSEEDLADLRSIERRVKLDDRPWSGKWCLRFEAIVLVYFVLMAVLMAATGAPTRRAATAPFLTASEREKLVRLSSHTSEDGAFIHSTR